MRIAAVAAALMAACATSGAAGFTLREGHPRLLLTPEAVDRIAADVKPGGPLEADWKIAVRHIRKRITEKSLSIRTSPTAALIYRVKNKLGDGDADDFLGYVKWVADTSKSGAWRPGYDQDQAIKIGLALDWVYERLADEDLRRYAVKYGKPGRRPGGSTWSSSPHMTHLAQLIRATLFHGAGIDDQAYAKDIETHLDYFRKDTHPAFDMCGGAYPSGYHYGREREFAVLWILEIMRTAFGEDLVSKNGFAREHGSWYLYNRLVGGEYSLPLFQDAGSSYSDPHNYTAYLAARAVRDRAMQWWAVRKRERNLKLDPDHWTHMEDWPQLLWFDPRLKPAAPPELAKAHLFGPGGMDVAVMRSGWGDDDTYVAVHGGDFYYGHQHAMAGHIEIWRRGPLAVDSGSYATYQAVPKSGGAQNRCGVYYRYSVAHNVLLVYKPEGIGLHTEMVRNRFNDGGQIRFGGCDNMGAWRRSKDGGKWNRSNVIAFESTPHYDYVALDATRAYNNGEKDSRLNSYVREVVFVRPGIIVVCDRVDAMSAEWSKHVQFHVMDKPVVHRGTGKQLAGKDDAAGIWRHRGTAVVEVTGGERLDGGKNGGKMVIVPVRPKCSIGIVGGPRRRMTVPDGSSKGRPYFGGTPDSFEYWSKPVGAEGGENCWFKLGRPTQMPSCVESGWGRVEIIPAEKRKRDVIVTVIAVGRRDERTAFLAGPVGEAGVEAKFRDTYVEVLFDPGARSGGSVKLMEGIETVAEGKLATRIRNTELPILGK